MERSRRKARPRSASACWIASSPITTRKRKGSRLGGRALTEIRFYQLRTTTLERALPQLLEKILARGDRAIVMAGSEERVEALNASLWTYDDRGFLPHGSARDGFEEDQPIWLATADRNPNGAKVLVLTDGAAASKLDDWTLVLEVFDGNDDGVIAAARVRWKEYRDAGHKLAYWRQSDSGRWEQG